MNRFSMVREAAVTGSDLRMSLYRGLVGAVVQNEIQPAYSCGRRYSKQPLTMEKRLPITFQFHSLHRTLQPLEIVNVLQYRTLITE